MIKLIAKNNWDFTLYEVEENYIISVVFFNSIADFSRSFKLTETEKNIQFGVVKRIV